MLWRYGLAGGVLIDRSGSAVTLVGKAQTIKTKITQMDKTGKAVPQFQFQVKFTWCGPSDAAHECAWHVTHC